MSTSTLQTNQVTAKGQQELISAIREMLSTNKLLFPEPINRGQWIEKELEKSPSEERLQEIISHMQSVIGDEVPKDSTHQEAHTSEESEELIF